MGTTARLIYADSEGSADLYYLTRFLAGDPFLYVEQGGRKTLILSDLEIDRARREATVHEFVRLQNLTEEVKKRVTAPPRDPAVRIGAHVHVFAEQRRIDAFEVPGTFPVAVADVLRGHGLGVHWLPPPFVPKRATKSAEEVRHIRRAIAHTEAAMTAAIERIRRARIRGQRLYEGSTPLTSEAVRKTVEQVLHDRGCHPYEAIIAGGDQGVDPHERGHGPLPANLPIILDIFPRDNATRYHGDMTRTVVRGRASAVAKRMFSAVREAKARAERLIRDGVEGRDVHEAVKKTFEKAKFRTGERKGRMVGFFHGTGHGLGLAVHEYPGLGQAPDPLCAGHVVTVEPGLYYPGAGGVRLEDDVLVTRKGCENLCTLPDEFEI
ncbi:MAG TPA: Xaa-Pro peptidase family protein [Planctomycetota bacterium]|nr:Xaa-Pro peptidase family protein [Planctomycetota bacterium]